MTYIHFFTGLSYNTQLAIPRKFAGAAYRLTNNARYLDGELALMVAQLPGAFWVK
jgi:hypothetical protein